MRWQFALIALVGCYAPHPQSGSPCNDNRECPSPLVCAAATDTCELADGDGGVISSDDAPPGTADAPLVDGCTPSGFDVCGDGIDQDCDGSDPVCAANDLPADAIDVTAGGMFTADLYLAHNDVPSAGCGGDGGRDVFFKVTLSAPRVFYFDTFGSGFDTSVRVFRGVACTSIGNAPAPICDDDSCGGGESQLALSLPAGTSCIVVDQNAATVGGDLMLRVINAGRDGTPLPAPVSGTSTVSGNTCGGPTATGGPCTNGAIVKGNDYFVPFCPGTVRVDVNDCSATWDSVVYALTADGTNIRCNDDNAACASTIASSFTNANVSGPGLFWVGVGGFDQGSCGDYTLSAHFH